MTSDRQVLASSFRDPAGFVFSQGGLVYRQVNQVYAASYNQLMDSGLYRALVEKGLLVPHEEVSSIALTQGGYKIIQTAQIRFFSYPYEWCFSQFKDAALATLRIQKIAIEHGMSLKDASSFNIQLVQGRSCLIDSLSFETFDATQPWVAYRQFCQHFLAPLALMAKTDHRLSKLALGYIDGVPLDLASKLLPWTTYFSPSLLTNLHLHAKAQSKYADKADGAVKKSNMTRFQHLAILDSLTSAIKGLTWAPGGTEWADYYTFTNYSDQTFSQKEKVVTDFIAEAGAKNLYDLGANMGHFSRLASKQGIPTYAFDIDHSAVEKNYLQIKKDKETNLFPLLLDLTAPTPAIGWANEERHNLFERGSADVVMALALIHHLSISNNLPFAKVAAAFARLGQHCIIEFVPKEDSQVKKLLATREDIFPEYDLEHFELEFSNYFTVIKKVSLAPDCRTMFLLKRK